MICYKQTPSAEDGRLCHEVSMMVESIFSEQVNLANGRNLSGCSRLLALLFQRLGSSF
jgi:hypothetical protein